MGVSIFTAVLINAAPFLIFWIAATVLAAVLLRRRGSRAEKFLLAGTALMLVNSILIIPGGAVVPYLVERGATMTDAASAASSLNLLRGIISMGGIICLVYAFWVKFKTRVANDNG